MKSEILCLNCKGKLDIPRYVNVDNYDGEILCLKCDARLYIKFKGSIQPVKYKLIEKPHIESWDIEVKTAVPRPNYGDEEKSA